MTSPPALVPSAHHVSGLTVSLMILTEPSPKRVFTPPGWKLRDPKRPPPFGPMLLMFHCAQSGAFEFGVWAILAAVPTPTRPEDQYLRAAPHCIVAVFAV